MGGRTKKDEAKEEMLEKRSTLQQAIKEFKQTLRKTARLVMHEDDEWLIRPSNVLKNGFKQLGIENRQAAVKGTIHLDQENGG